MAWGLLGRLLLALAATPRGCKQRSILADPLSFGKARRWLDLLQQRLWVAECGQHFFAFCQLSEANRYADHLLAAGTPLPAAECQYPRPHANAEQFSALYHLRAGR